ncbi:hypothetical protein EV286_11577 [Rhizobium sp. BK251]|nr:hypothetical protein EV286_11577 [Rhizobium sp. BK251]
MYNPYRMDDKDWVSKLAQDGENWIDFMTARQMSRGEMGPIVRNSTDSRKQLIHVKRGLPRRGLQHRRTARARQNLSPHGLTSISHDHALRC